MNIYLDIDGVLIGAKSPQKDIVKLIRYILKHYSDSTYWLTSHCRGGTNRCAEWLRQSGLPGDLVDEMNSIIKPTDWGVMKTEAIDMNSDFVWFDDSLFEVERQALEAHRALGSFYRMDPKNPKSAKMALEYLESLV